MNRTHHAWPWRLVGLRAICAGAFGVAAFGRPDVVADVFVGAVASYMLADAALTVALGTQARVHERSYLLLAEGIGGVAAGLFLLFASVLSWATALAVIGLWAMATGGLEIAAAIRIHSEQPREPMLGGAGMASLLAGALMLSRPARGALAITLLFGAYALVFGAAMLGFAWMMRRRVLRMGLDRKA